ncbi:MAG: hypothetical protein WCH46_07990 [bacterium]
MTSVIEDRIIEYFEGSLNDADSAELLHRVSVSPEIRDLFHQHEKLRETAHSAMNSAVISPSLEASIFAKVEAMASAKSRKKAVMVFSRQSAVVAALAIMLISGSLGYFVPKYISDNKLAQVAALTQQSPSQLLSTLGKPITNNLTSLIPSTTSTSIEKTGSAVIHSRRATSSQSDNQLSQVHNLSSASTQDVAVGNNLMSKNIAATEGSTTELISSNPALMPKTSQVSDLGGNRRSLQDLRYSDEQTASTFEVGIQTSSGFTYPASATTISPFADQRLSLGYHLTENNVVGLRVGSGLYQQLSEMSPTNDGGVVYMSRHIETKRNFNEELFYTHLFPISLGAPFLLEFTVDGGIIPNGYNIGLECGVRIPMNEHFMFDAAFALSRIHTNSLSTEQIVSSTQVTKPVVFESVDMQNTLNGRLHYGLLYRF